jgi:hypothetical protein
MQMVQKPAFSSVPGINKNFNITQDSSPGMYLKYRVLQKELYNVESL